jgi:ferredoxin
MKVTVDTSKCSGFASCVLSAPEVFDLDEAANVAAVIDSQPAVALRADVREAARSCPTGAVILTE